MRAKKVYPVSLIGPCDDLLLRCFKSKIEAEEYAEGITDYYRSVTDSKQTGEYEIQGDLDDLERHHPDAREAACNYGGPSTLFFVRIRKVPLGLG